MMGRLNHDQEQFFYSFRLDEAVPGDHPVRGDQSHSPHAKKIGAKRNRQIGNRIYPT
jgi:hypothetical protein